MSDEWGWVLSIVLLLLNIMYAHHSLSSRITRLEMRIEEIEKLARTAQVLYREETK